MKLIYAPLVCVLLAGPALAQEAEEEMAPPKVSFANAVSIAAEAAKGDLVSLALDYTEEGAPVYVADLEGNTSVTRLLIDADGGKVMASEVISAESEEAMDTYFSDFSTESGTLDMAEEDALVELLYLEAQLDEAFEDDLDEGLEDAPADAPKEDG